MDINWLYFVDSTNAYVREHTELPPMTMVCAFGQTAGRGQRGNSWESEPGANLTFSFRIPEAGVSPASQFVISEATALAVADVLDEFGFKAMVKWPNDIYVGDRKIAGILIENSVTGTSISQSIVGIGLNVNQTEFRSDAPNPVSMAMLAGRPFGLTQVAEALAARFDAALSNFSPQSRGRIHEAFKSRLWRADGQLHPFVEAASGLTFRAEIAGVEPSGHIILKRDDGSCRRHAFKEISFVL